MRYAYGLTSALLVGGAAISLVTGFPAGAQVAQNEGIEMERAVPRAGAPESFADLTAQLQPAVVNISTRQRIEIQQSANPFAGTPFADLFGQRGRSQPQQSQPPQTREAQSLGSGFIISADGYVVTNNHVISPPRDNRGTRGTVEEITVTMPDGTEYPAELVGNDAPSDLAVLKIKRSEPFPFVKFGDSTRARVGDWVIAIGNPFGLGGTVTSGIVSAVYRNAGGGAYDRYLQTDASINSGNSGGPLFDMRGNVIGINNAILSPSGGSVGIGFAIPADVAAPIVDQLRAGKKIERGYLGVSIQPVNPDMANALGLPKNRGEIVQVVRDDSPAKAAGIQPGDIVTRVNNKEITPDQTLSFLVANTAPGTRIPVELYRDGKRRTVTMTVGQFPSQEELAEEESFDPDAETPMPESGGSGMIEKSIGLQVIALTPQIAQQLGLSTDTSGVVVAAVDPNSDAGTKGLRRGDVILSANYKAVTTPGELENIAREAKAGGREALFLRFQRRGSPPVFTSVRFR